MTVAVAVVKGDMHVRGDEEGREKARVKVLYIQRPPGGPGAGDRGGDSPHAG